MTGRCCGRRYWRFIQVSWNRSPVCDHTAWCRWLLVQCGKKERAWIWSQKTWVCSLGQSLTSLWFCFFINIIFIIKKCLSKVCKVLCKSLFTFFTVICLGLNISTFYTDSEYCLSIFLLTITCVEPVRDYQKSQRSHINYQVGRQKPGMTQNPLMGHWEMRAQQCLCSHSTWWNPQAWSNGMFTEIHG